MTAMLLRRRPEEELEAWVIEELDRIAAEWRADARAETGAGDDAPADEAPRSVRRDAAAAIPSLSREEERFIADSVAWLRGRPDPDLLLEEMWRQLVDAGDCAADAADPDGADAVPPPAGSPPEAAAASRQAGPAPEDAPGGGSAE